MKIGNTLVSGTGIGTMVMNDKEESTESNKAMTLGSSGDTVTFSEEAMQLSKSIDGTGALSKDDSDSTNQQEQLIKNLEKQVKQLQKEIEKIKQQNLPEDEKNKLIQAKQQELTQIQSQIAEARQQLNSDSGIDNMGGTAAKGFSNSLT